MVLMRKGTLMGYGMWQTIIAIILGALMIIAIIWGFYNVWGGL